MEEEIPANLECSSNRKKVHNFNLHKKTLSLSNIQFLKLNLTFQIYQSFKRIYKKNRKMSLLSKRKRRSSKKEQLKNHLLLK